MKNILTIIPLLSQQIEQLSNNYDNYSKHQEIEQQYQLTTSIQNDPETIEIEMRKGENLLSQLFQNKEMNNELILKGNEILSNFQLIQKAPYHRLQPSL